MTVRIEAGKITESSLSERGFGQYKRLLIATDVKLRFMQHTIFANTKEELEIIDYENFMKE